MVVRSRMRRLHPLKPPLERSAAVDRGGGTASPGSLSRHSCRPGSRRHHARRGSKRRCRGRQRTRRRRSTRFPVEPAAGAPGGPPAELCSGQPFLSLASLSLVVNGWSTSSSPGPVCPANVPGVPRSRTASPGPASPFTRGRLSLLFRRAGVASCPDSVRGGISRYISPGFESREGTATGHGPGRVGTGRCRKRVCPPGHRHGMVGRGDLRSPEGA